MAHKTALRPSVIVQRVAGKAKVLLGCEQAARAGIRPGMPLAEAQAVAPQLAVHEQDQERDRRGLQKLAVWAERFSPIVGLEESLAPECLLLDVTGCAGCFHGEDRLVQRALRELHEQRWKARAAIAGTVGAAWALAHYMRSWFVAPSELLDPTLLALPVAALRLPGAALETLAALGIDTIGQLHALPRTGLASRFDPVVLQRLDQALGAVPEPIVPYRSLPDVQARCSFEYPTERRDLLNQALDHLLERLSASLRKRNRGARQLECWFSHEVSRPLRIDVGLCRPSRDPEHLGKLLRARLEQVHFDEPVRGICLRAPVLEVLPEQTGELFAADDARAGELATLIDHLSSRLGNEAVTFARLVADPQPEYACRFEESGVRGQRLGDRGRRLGGRRQETGVRGNRKRGEKETNGEVSSLPPDPCPLTPDPYPLTPDFRPVQIWPTPVPIEVVALVPPGTPSRVHWEGMDHAVVRFWGPERIETGWWRGQDIHRDYYVVQTERGPRLWIFRRHEDGRWFLHGTFD